MLKQRLQRAQAQSVATEGPEGAASLPLALACAERPAKLDAKEFALEGFINPFGLSSLFRSIHVNVSFGSRVRLCWGDLLQVPKPKTIDALGLLQESAF